MYQILPSQTLQTQVTFSNPSDPYHYAEEVCTDLEEYSCCAPVDFAVHSQRGTGFHAQWVDYIGIPPEITAHVWRYAPDSSWTNCDDIIAATIGSNSDCIRSYRSSSPRPGLSGGWYYDLARNENTTFVLPPVGLVGRTLSAMMG